MYKLILLLFPLLFVSCKHSEEFTGYSYDPPDVTNTTDKELNPQPRRIIATGSPLVWVHNRFDGARLNDFYVLNDSTFELLIKPERAPINNSPWYAFKIWSDSAQKVNLKLTYKAGKHRYIPKISRKVKGKRVVLQPEDIQYDSTNHTATFSLKVSPDTTLVSAQSIYTSDIFLDELRERGITDTNSVQLKIIGHSKQGRPLYELEFGQQNPESPTPVLVILSRQHPPEISGYLASLIFLEELTSDSALAREFRSVFKVIAYPMVNPDGVDNGHWRYNMGGVDLNRDWVNFNQPETRTVRNALLPLKSDTLLRPFYAIDFHSTDENIFYPILPEIKTYPDNISQRWITRIKEQNPDTEFAVEAFDTNSPISKNWFYRTFGIDALTYEVNDEIAAEKLDRISRKAARSMMRVLLNEWDENRP